MCKAPLASINKLPTEILELIFLELIQLHLYWFNQLPIALSQVCTRWRLIALSLSSLWSHLELSDPKTRWSVHGFPVWLKRSRDQGLHVNFRWREANVIPTLSSIIHRCQDLVLTMDKEAAQAATAIPFANASRLQYIEIRLPKCNDQQIVDDICAKVRFAPNLKAIKITSRSLPPDLLTRPWPHLTSLNTTAEISGSHLALIAKNLPQLTHLYIHPLALGRLNARYIQFPNLESLSVDFRWLPISEYFDVLSTPCLKSLYASCPYLPEDRNLPQSLDNFLSRSKHHLESLSLEFPSEQELRDCVQIPSLYYLHELNLSCSWITDETVKLFLSSETSGTSIILPHLQSLSMDCCVTSDGVVSQILASRFQHGKSSPPRSLKFACIDLQPPEDVNRGHTASHDRDEQAFEQLIEEGLDIRGRWIFYRKYRKMREYMF